MPPRAERAILVVGVGRSGTSLAMQALLRLGAGVSRDLVPASENNPRGAFEDTEVRDRMRALGSKFGYFQGRLRPPDWREEPLVMETEEWLAGHLDALATDCDRPAVAVKFPLASAYLPIWYDAATRIELPLSVVWATRNAQDTIASLIRAYDFDLDLAKIRYLQRLSPLMKDLRPDALLLPYEGWTRDPVAQIHALAEYVNLPLGEEEAAVLDDLFDPSVNHGGDAAIELDPLTRQVDKMISGQLGRFGDLVGSDPERLCTLSHHLAATLEAADENRRLRKRSEAAEKELASTRAALGAAEARLDAAEAEAARLRDACDVLSRTRDAEQAARDDRAAALEAEILQLRGQGEKLSQALRSAEALARKKTGEAEAASAQIARMRGSRRWRFGDRLARVGLPFRLVRSLWVRSR